MVPCRDMFNSTIELKSKIRTRPLLRQSNPSRHAWENHMKVTSAGRVTAPTEYRSPPIKMKLNIISYVFLLFYLVFPYFTLLIKPV